MKIIFFIMYLIFLTNCSGYSPVFTSGKTNFYIEEISFSENDKLLRKISKNLKPYTIDNNQAGISIELNLKKNENVILRDSKGDASTIELGLNLIVNIILENGEKKKLEFNEKFSYQNESNKFELNQYKKNVEENLIDKIFEKLILQLKTL
tara:strand:+ start:2069 stop:2521 length:453 start_codon:yes stop_codon:yes gene_type:complete